MDVVVVVGMEVVLGPSDIVLDGGPSSLPKKGHTCNFHPCLLWPNGGRSQLVK